MKVDSNLKQGSRAQDHQKLLKECVAVVGSDGAGQFRSKSCDAAFGPRQALMLQASRYTGTQDLGASPPTFWLGNGDPAIAEVQKLRQVVVDWQTVSENAQMERDNVVRQVQNNRLVVAPPSPFPSARTAPGGAIGGTVVPGGRMDLQSSAGGCT